MKRFSKIIVILSLGWLLIGCAAKDWQSGDPLAYTNAERLIVKGCVTNEAAQPLQGIRVDVYGVREAKEPDLVNYNYAITDSAGNYTIVRYMGREMPNEVTVEAIDPQNIYKPQAIVAQKTVLESLTNQVGNEIAIRIEVNFTLNKQ